MFCFHYPNAQKEMFFGKLA